MAWMYYYKICENWFAVLLMMIYSACQIATSNKFVWPPQKEEELHSSLLATAIPLYIPPVPSQPKDPSIIAVPDLSSQNQSTFSEESHSITHPINYNQQLPQIQKEVIPEKTLQQQVPNQQSDGDQCFEPIRTELISSSSQPSSDFISKLSTSDITTSGLNISFPAALQNSNEEQHVETHLEEKFISTEVTSETENKKTEEHIKKTSVCSQEVSFITKSETTELSVLNIQDKTSLGVEEIQRPLSPLPPTEEAPSNKLPSSSMAACEEVESNQRPLTVTPPQEEALLPGQNSSLLISSNEELITEQISSSLLPSAHEETEVTESSESENIQSISQTHKEIESSSEQKICNESISDMAQLITQETAMSDLKQSDVSSISTETLTQQLLPDNPGINPSDELSTTYTNKGLSYKQLPIPEGGDFIPISLEQQTAECQEVSNYTSKEFSHKILTSGKSICNSVPVPFSKQMASNSPKFNINQSPSSNPGSQLPSRSEACQSPMVSALTIAPDRPYFPIPSAVKPQTSISEKSLVPNKPHAADKAISSDTTTSGHETQLPFLPASSERISMVAALTIASDRPYSPFTKMAPTPNTVVQSEASAFTAVSPQTINTKPIMTTPQQSILSSQTNVSQSYLHQPLPTSDTKRTAFKPISPRPSSRSSLPVMGAFRPTVPVEDLRPQTPIIKWQTDSTKNTSVEKVVVPSSIQETTFDEGGRKVVVQRTTHVEESSVVSHKEMHKTILRSSGQIPSVSSSSKQLCQKSNISSTLMQKTSTVDSQLKQGKTAQYQQQKQIQEKSTSSLDRQQTQKSGYLPSSQPWTSTAPMVSQYQKQQQQQQKQLYSLSGVQKPAVIPFYQQDIGKYQKQRALSPAPHSQQVQRALTPVPEGNSTNIQSSLQSQTLLKSSTSSSLLQQQSVSQSSADASLPIPEHPIIPQSISLSKEDISHSVSTSDSKVTKNLSTSEFSLPFPNIPLPEGFSVESLMKDAKLSTKSTILTTKPQPSQVASPITHAFKTIPTAQPLQTLPSLATKSSPNAFKPYSPQNISTGPQKENPSVATQPSSVTKIPVPPSSSSIPNAGGGIGGGVGGGPTGQKGSASFAGSSAPRRGRGVLNQQTPGARIPLCGHCNGHVRGPFITALGKIWCPEHFVCVNGQCRRPLQDIGFVEEKGELYCEFCFEQFIAPTCNKCSKKIKGDCLNAISKHFHPECFLCAYCGKHFGNNPFFLEDGLAYCDTDWNELFTTKCFACGFPIEAGDRWVEALNNNYHSQCFNCTSCKKNLEGQNFYAKGGRPFCKAHAR